MQICADNFDVPWRRTKCFITSAVVASNEAPGLRLNRIAQTLIEFGNHLFLVHRSEIRRLEVKTTCDKCRTNVRRDKLVVQVRSNGEFLGSVSG